MSEGKITLTHLSYTLQRVNNQDHHESKMEDLQLPPGAEFVQNNIIKNMGLKKEDLQLLPGAEFTQNNTIKNKGFEKRGPAAAARRRVCAE